ncbi:hypothetical protein Ntsu_79270 [Nocardia sp. IFM 10818]
MDSDHDAAGIDPNPRAGPRRSDDRREVCDPMNGGHGDQAPARAGAENLMPACGHCDLERRAGAIGFVRTARWAVVSRDCCTGTDLEQLLCQPHFLALVGQPLPGRCERCGHISRSVHDIVDRAMTVGAEPTL